jgi:peptidoglycan hydrolase-like protein with peptidoglycan-binding domain
VVVALQKKLRIKADGAYGPKTKRAVRRFQRRRNMKADGIARPSVLTKLRIDARAAAKAPRVPPVLERIAQCESGGNPRAVSATGLYRGKYQFSMATWRRMGGEGDPAQAPEARQDRMAAKLFAAQGLAPWPHCGARA